MSPHVAISDFLSRLRKQERPPDGGSAPVAHAYPTKGLPQFLAGLSAKEQPVLLDLGSVVGTNVTFFGEQLNCKISVEDLAKDIDRSRSGRPTERAAGVSRDAVSTGPGKLRRHHLLGYLRLPRAPCRCKCLAAQVARLLRPEGVVLAFFNHSEQAGGGSTYTRHVVVDRRTLEHKPYPAARGKQRPLLNRDIQRMFEPLKITDQFLLKTNMREVVFRKAAAASDVRSPNPGRAAAWHRGRGTVRMPCCTDAQLRPHRRATAAGRDGQGVGRP